MTYRNNAELPESVKSNLPAQAQDVYRSAFNSAWLGYRAQQEQSKTAREEKAHKVAWAAVKRRFQESGGGWSLKH